MPALAIEPLAGQTLLDLLRADAGLAGEARFGAILKGLAAALASLHRHGIVHGDVKPDHIFVADDDTVRLADFSAAWIEGRPATSDDGLVWLTPGFAAPEQLAAGAAVDARADVFAFGAVTFWAATGHAAPDGADNAAAIEAALRASPLAPDLRDLTLACLDSDPASRPADADALGQALTPTAAAAQPERAQNRVHDEVPPTLLVRRRTAPVRESGGGRLFAWLLFLAGLAGAGFWWGQPLYEKHVKATWLISSDGSGDAVTLSDAVARAGTSAVFLLGTGEHQGATLGDGDYRIEPAPQAAEPPVIVAGAEGCLTGIRARIVVSGIVFRDAGGDGCVRQSGGSLEFQTSTFERTAGAAITARDGANLTIADSSFLGIGGDAIRIEGGGTLALRDSKVSGTTGNAVVVAGGATATLRRNLISDSGATGLLVAQGGEVRVEGGVIRGSAASAVEIASGGRAILREVTLSDSAAAGIFLHGESHLSLSASEVLNNQLSGLFVDHAAGVEVEDSVIADNGEHGVLSLGSRDGRLARNEIVRNAGYGLVLDPQTRLTLTDNSLESNMSGPLMDVRRTGGKKKGGGAE